MPRERLVHPERLRAVVDAIPNGFAYEILVERDGTRRFEYVSAGVERVTGVPTAEALRDAAAIYDLVDPADRPALAAAEEAVLAAEGVFDFVFRLRRRDGRSCWMHANSHSRRLPDGRSRAEGFLLDITERRVAEERQRESEARFRAFIEQAGDGFELKDARGRFVDANEATCRQLGYTRDELLGLTLADVDPLWTPERYAAAFADLERRGTNTFETLHRRKDGTTFPVEVTTSIVRLGGEPFAMAITRDISARRRAEEELRARRETIDGIVESSKDWIWETDLTGRHVFSSPAVKTILGYTPEEFVGRGLDLLHPEDRARVEARMPEWINGRKGWSGVVLRWRHRDGSFRHLESSAVPVLDAQGELTGFRGVDRDITERIQAEEEREALRGRLAEAERLEAVGRFAGGVAHEFNNMLGVILGNVAFAIEALPPGSGPRRELEEIRVAAERSADLARELLAFARRQAATPRTLDLNDAVAALLPALGRLFPPRVGLVWKPGSWVGRVRIDPAQFQQLLASLCANARDGIDGAGCVEIATRVLPAGGSGAGEAAFVELSVSDDGRGMPAEAVRHAFEPFFGANEGRQGKGIGLAAVHGVALQNGGRVDLTSEPGRGTCVRVILPRHEDERRESEARSTVLIVEDEPSLLSLCRRLITDMGHAALTAVSPAEALRLAESHPEPIDLLMIDLMLPEMDGRTLMAKLCALRPAARAILMSGYDEAGTGGGGGGGKPLFLRKPFTRRELEAAVRAAFERGEDVGC